MSGTQDKDDDNGIAELIAKRNGQPPPGMRGTSGQEVDQEVEDREPAKPDAQSEAEATAARYKRQVADLQNRANTAEQRANAEAQRARQATEEVQRTRREGDEMGYATVVSQIEAFQAQQAELKASFRDAFEKGDADRMSDISARQGAIAARLQTLEDGKVSYEAQRNAKLREPAPQAQAQPQQGDRLPNRDAWRWGMASDQFLQLSTAPTREWLEDHPEFFTDRKFFQAAGDADREAVENGYARDTRRYFTFVEQQLKDAGVMDKPSERGERGERRAHGGESGSRAPASLAPSRDVPGRRVREGDIVITPEDRYGAELTSMGSWKQDPQEFAKEKARLIASGEWPIRRR